MVRLAFQGRRSYRLLCRWRTGSARGYPWLDHREREELRQCRNVRTPPPESSRDIDPQGSRNETGEVPHVRRRNDHVRSVKCCGLCGQDDVAVKRGVGCRRPPLLASFSPELCGLAHRRRRDGQVPDLSDKGVEPAYAGDPTGSNQLSSDFVIGDLRNDHGRAATDRSKKPPATGGGLR